MVLAGALRWSERFCVRKGYASKEFWSVAWEAAERALDEYDGSGSREGYVRLRVTFALREAARHGNLLTRRAYGRGCVITRVGLVQEFEQYGVMLGTEATQEADTNAVWLRERLRSAVRRLPRDQQRLVVEHYWQDEEFQNTARSLGISKGWASRRHAKALTRIKTEIGAQP